MSIDEVVDGLVDDSEPAPAKASARAVDREEQGRRGGRRHRHIRHDGGQLDG
ncbi:MAG: hypothetical protein U5L03_05845 [Burkholderiaceae bacterium]|nr:hypothetical protein [Burkholderiaceae bacterium]